MQFAVCASIALLSCTCTALFVPSPLILAQQLHNTSAVLHHDGTNAAKLAVRAPTLRCQPIHYGTNVVHDSCEQALSKMPRSPGTKIYAGRQMNTGVRLPLRYLSDDGACAIDVDQKRKIDAATVDFSSDQSIAAQAGILVDTCVLGRGYGGYISSFSKYKCIMIRHIACPKWLLVMIRSRKSNTDKAWTDLMKTGENDVLIITVRKNVPRVHCEPGGRLPPSPQICDIELEDMFARKHSSNFVSENSQFRGPNKITLPRHFGYGPCKLSFSCVCLLLQPVWRLRFVNMSNSNIL